MMRLTPINCRFLIGISIASCLVHDYLGPVQLIQLILHKIIQLIETGGTLQLPRYIPY